MSKKKVLGGSTTIKLRDFHGGSIPSDLPFFSAPGTIVRPLDCPGFDRQGSWGNPVGRSDHWLLWPSSAGAVRNYDDKASFLNPIARIGRNFDEDERKPLDGVLGPRKTISDESIRAMPIRTELKPDYSSIGKLPGRQFSPPASQLSSSSASSYAGRAAESTYMGVNSRNYGRFAEADNVGVKSSNLGGNSGVASSGTYLNAWEIRKEASSTTEPLPGISSGPNAASKLAHVSVLEKVSSGRSQFSQPIHHPTDVEVIRHTTIETESRSKGDNFYNKSSYHPVGMVGRVEYHDSMVARHAEGGGRELAIYERAGSPMLLETVENNPPSYVDGVQPARNEGKFGGSELESPLPSEQSERSKLNLLLGHKPLESLEPPADYNQGYQQPQKSDHLENGTESYGNANHTNSVLSRSDSGNRAVECPKLNLKPRSQPLEQFKGNIERESAPYAVRGAWGNELKKTCKS